MIRDTDLRRDVDSVDTQTAGALPDAIGTKSCATGWLDDEASLRMNRKHSPRTEAGGGIKRRTDNSNVVTSLSVSTEAPDRGRPSETVQAVVGFPCPSRVRHISAKRSEDLGEVELVDVVRVDDAHGVLDAPQDLSSLAHNEGSGAETGREDHGECWATSVRYKFSP